MNKSIIIRVDGDQNIGLGHLVRCLSLAQMLKSEFQNIQFVSKRITSKLKNEVISGGFLVHEIQKENEFFSLLNDETIAVVDGYTFDLEYQKQIKAIGSKLVFIDDLHKMKFVADLIINQAPGVTQVDYDAQDYTKFCLGPDYSLLRPHFLKEARIPRVIKEIQSVFICFGGADFKNLTELVAKYILTDQDIREINVVVGSANNNVKGLQYLAEKNPEKIKLAVGLNDAEMSEMMLKSQIAIVPASGILFEVIALNLIAVSGYYINNQKAIYTGFKKNNAFYDAKSFSTYDLDTAFKQAKLKGPEGKFLQENLIDGLSADRIKAMFLGL